MAAQAGWYVDPRDARQYRYWDGERWSQSTQPIPELNEASPFGDSSPTGSLSGGGAKEPVGAGVFDQAPAADPSAISDGVIADFMWTAGFGESPNDAAANSAPAMFSPAAAPVPPAPPAPVPPAPPVAQQIVPPVVAAPVFQPGSNPVAPPASQLSSKQEFTTAAAAPTPFAPQGSDPAFLPPAPLPPAVPPAIPPAVPPVAPIAGAIAATAATAATAAVAGGPQPMFGNPPFNSGPATAPPGVAPVPAGPSFGSADAPELSKAERKAQAKAAKAAKDVKPPKPAKGANGEPKSRLPVLLGALVVILIGEAGVFVFITGGNDDDDGGSAGTKVAGTTVDRSGSASTVAPTASTGATPTTGAVAPTTVTVPVTGAPNVAALQQSFDAEVTRACDIIKADPGKATEDVIQYDSTWASIPKTYEELQRAVNECSQAARDDALRRIAESEAANG